MKTARLLLSQQKRMRPERLKRWLAGQGFDMKRQINATRSEANKTILFTQQTKRS